MKEIISSQISFYFNRADLFEKICNISALNAKYVSEEVNIDSLVLTQDEKYFFDTNIEPIVTSLAGYFVRIITGSDETYSVTESEVRLVFNAAPLADGRLTQVEVDILHSLVEEYIITETLRLWYHSVAPNEMLAAKYVGATASLDRRLRIALFQFYKPTGENSIINCIKVKDLQENNDVTHINNRSDFVLLWSPKNINTLPASFTISFYTTGRDLYEVSYPDPNTKAPKVVPIADAEGKVVAAHIIFDLNTAGNYFQDGRLRYTMVSNIENPMFDDGLQTIETSDELPIEIWDGPSDQTLSIDATFVPAYAKLMLADLTPEEIAILQSPATKAAAKALSAATSANERSEEAREAAGHAQKQGDYAKEEGDKAQQAIIGYDAKIQELTELKQSISDAEVGRENAEVGRENAEAQRSKHWGTLSTTLNEAINSAYRNSSAARVAAEAADKARAETIKTNSDILGVEELRVLAEYTRQTNEEDRIRHENDRIGEENSRKSAETTRNQQEQIRQDNERLRQDAEKVREKKTTNAIDTINGKISEANTAIGSIEQKVSEANEAIKEANEATAKANKAAEAADTAREGITEALGSKADNNGSYPNMTVGKADALNTPSGSILHSQFVRLGAVWNDSTKFWELNGLTDLTTSQMETIWNAHITMGYCQSRARTNFTNNFWRTGGYNNQALLPSKGMFGGSDIEVFIGPASFANLQTTFAACNKLRKVGNLTMSYANNQSVTNAFSGCTSLTELYMDNICKNIDFSDCPLTIESIVFMITRSRTLNNSVITLRSDIYQQAIADERVQEALATHTNITLAEAE